VVGSGPPSQAAGGGYRTFPWVKVACGWLVSSREVAPIGSRAADPQACGEGPERPSVFCLLRIQAPRARAARPSRTP